MTERLDSGSQRCGKTIMPQIIKKMKEQLPTDPRTKPYYDKIRADGFTEEQAVDIMIYAWIEGMNGDVE